ncbi:catecholate siderophore receptor CirA [Lacunisphaera limnophila]|uniref:Catecholate siderophore receptor CirA n=1 Tax=Lacunisphaera limnophila TaxID=1838286 RepID=A0A1D8AUD1_9BACT|nr:TonB-dependent receptor [Lacunisphaera limnophila]AOS44480.1 catecholate siderophore receptor CirA [Lacunisphaera limnophila]
MEATLTLWQRFARTSPSAATPVARLTPLRTLASAVVALFLAGTAFAQDTGSINGRVLNVGNNRYLNNAKVTVEGTNLEAYTNEFGDYRLANVPAGEVKLKAAYTGLDEETVTVNVTAGGAATYNFELTSRARYGEDKTLVLDTFVVESQREYEGDALATNEQRHAPNVKVVMSSDSFGTINEGNPGEFLKYLPGITVDYVAADVRTVSVRGFAAQFTNVYWDGMRLTSSASGSSNRIFEFEQVSINNTSRTEVSKVPTPDMPSDSLGGTINFVSKNAFERKGAQLNYRFYMNANSENLDLKKTPGPDSDKNFKILPNFDFDYTLPLSDTFGIVVTGLSSNQFVEQHRWQPTWNHAQAGATASNPYLQQWQIQDGPKTTNRASLGIKADWKVTDTQVLSVALQNNYYKTYFGNRNLNFNMGTTATSTPAGRNPLLWGSDFATSAFGRGSVTTGSSHRDKLGNTFAAKVGHQWKSGDWTADTTAMFAKSRTWYRAVTRGHFSNVGTTVQGVGTVSSFGSTEPGELVWVARNAAGAEIDVNNLANHRIGTLRDDPIDGEAITKQIRGDLERQLDLSFPLSVKVGYDIREETRDNRRYQNDYTFIGADGVANTADDSAAPYLDTVYANQDAHFGYGPINWVNAWALADAYKNNPNYFRLGTGTAQTGVQAELFRRQNSERITERVTSGYIQFDGRLLNNKLGFVAGARYEKTNDKGLGLLNNPDAVWQRNPDGTYVDGNTTTAGIQRVRRADAGTAGSLQELDLTSVERGYKADRDYDSINPSLHLTYNIKDDLLVRFAYAKTFGRPDYANIIPATTVNEDDTDPINNPGTLTIRNTGLQPWTADNYDLSLEYYFKEGGLVSAGVFVKDLQDFWGSRTGTVDAALAEELGIGSEYIGWGVSTTVNTGDAKIEGVEVNFIRPLTFLPGWGKFFTIKANGTQLRLSGPRATDFRGFIEETGNFNIGFNKKPFSANLTFNYRGRQKNAPQTGAQYGATAGFYEYYAPRTFVDVSGEMKITKNIALFAGVRNLFNKQQVLQRYNAVTPDYAKGFRYEEFGVAMSIGIKGSF